MLFYGMMAGSLAANIEAGAAGRQARSAAADVHVLENRLDRALLATEALWSIVREKLGVSEEELITRINDIDLSDGALDGKVRKKPVSCPKCHRTISPRFNKCMYCGQPVMQDPFA